MRKRFAAFVVLATLTSGLAYAAIDLSDFDDDVMRAMDDAFKDLEPVLGARNAEAAAADVEVLQQGYQWTLDYFAAKGNAEDAVNGAKEGQALLNSVTEALARQDYEAASAAARATAKNCRACHDLYKPLTK